MATASLGLAHSSVASSGSERPSFRPPPGRRAVSGFSLIELLVVFFIIIIIAATAIPMGLNFVRNYQVEGAAQRVAMEIQKARSQAVKQNSRRGILLALNYPATSQMQWVSLDPDPMTGDWDDAIYPKNPGEFRTGEAYGTLPTPPNNVAAPDAAAGMLSPHGVPLPLPVNIAFEGADLDALLFRADGSVAGVQLEGGPGVAAAVTALGGGNGWRVQVTDQDYGILRYIYVSPNGRVTIRQSEI